MADVLRKMLVVEDEPLMASLLAESLTSAGFDVEKVHNVADARQIITTFDPDLVLLDISLGDGPTGVHLAHAIHRTSPEIAILVLTKHPDAKTASRDGLDLPPGVGFHRKHLVNDKDYLLDAIEKVLSDKAAEVRQDITEANELAALQPQALSILRLIAEGYNNAEIAIRCDLSVKSVERWIERLYRDLQIEAKGAINPRIEAARRFFTVAGIPERKVDQ